MSRAKPRFILSFFILVLVSATAISQEPADRPPTFEKDIVPVLREHCFKCHGAEKQESGLDLRRRFSIIEGGDSGPALVPNEPTKSLLLELIEDELMPPEAEPRLSPDEVALLRSWIATGASIAGSEEPPLPRTSLREGESFASARSHWAFQPVTKVGLPAVQNRAWVRTPIDTFILAALEHRGWQPAHPATRANLIRRVHFDLLGLPPTPEAIASFVNDPAPDAYERLVDRVLASPHYGERWAQHWLDVVRFAETEGFEYDRHLPDAWRYRDYVIEAFNRDKPYDRFVCEQIAGDEMRGDEASGENLVGATAAIFHRLGAVRRNAGNPDIALSRNEVLTERTNIIGEAFLALSVGCARCHNHKLEPISQRDYYRLQAYFAATEEHNVSLGVSARTEAAEVKELEAALEQLKEEAKEATGEEKLSLDKEIAKQEYELALYFPTIPSIRNDFDNRTQVHVLRRGVWELKGVAVGPRPLSVLVPDELAELPADVTRPRSELAKWIASDDHPLTARVIVNRLWQQHFGVGIVKSANDFGTQGDKPSHPDLIDFLSHLLIEHDWRLKPLHRMILLSNTYRQSGRSLVVDEVSVQDPENRHLSYFNRRRLSGEEIRDAMLASAGRLNARAGGRSVMVPVDRELIDLLYKPTQWQVAEDVAEYDRRSIYLIAKRNLRLPFMQVFDAPALQTSCPARESSTHAPQTLELLNGEFVNQMAVAFAKRLTSECREDASAVVDRAFQLALGRAPTEVERRLSLDFLQDQPLREFTLALFNLNEFLYVE